MKHAHEKYAWQGRKVSLTEAHKGWKAGTKGRIIDEINLSEGWMEVITDQGDSYGAMRVPYDKLAEEEAPPDSETITVRGVD